MLAIRSLTRSLQSTRLWFLAVGTNKYLYGHRDSISLGANSVYRSTLLVLIQWRALTADLLYRVLNADLQYRLLSADLLWRVPTAYILYRVLTGELLWLVLTYCGGEPDC